MLEKQEKKVIERVITKVRDVKIICLRQMESLANHLDGRFTTAPSTRPSILSNNDILLLHQDIN